MFNSLSFFSSTFIFSRFLSDKIFRRFFILCRLSMVEFCVRTKLMQSSCAASWKRKHPNGCERVNVLLKCKLNNISRFHISILVSCVFYFWCSSSSASFVQMEKWKPQRKMQTIPHSIQLHFYIIYMKLTNCS